ncbi:MAG: hypothetical protein ACYTG0_13780 [Planctomycetota bacterium]
MFSSEDRPIRMQTKVSKLSDMLFNQVRAWLDAANRRDARAWAEVDSREDWEAFAGQRIEALRRSLGTFPKPPDDLNVQVARTIRRDGLRIENLVFQSRPGLIVTANLYVPDPPRERMPGIVICHRASGDGARKTGAAGQVSSGTFSRRSCSSSGTQAGRATFPQNAWSSRQNPASWCRRCCFSHLESRRLRRS